MSYEGRKARDRQSAPRRGRPNGLEGWDQHITGAPLTAVRMLSSIAKSQGLSMADVARALDKPRQNFGQALTAKGRISETIREFAKVLALPPLAQRVLFQSHRLAHRERRAILARIRHEITRFCADAAATLNELGAIIAGMSPAAQGEIFAAFVLAPYVDASAAENDLAVISRPLAALEEALKAKGHGLPITPQVDVVQTIKKREREAAIEFERFVDVFNLDDAQRGEIMALLKRFGRWPKSRISDFDVLFPDEARAIFPHFADHSTTSPSTKGKDAR